VITRPKSTFVLAGVLAGLLAVLAIGGPAGARPLASAHRTLAHAAVIGGAAATPGALSSVVDIIDLHGREGAQCTGTVVAPTLILTAGHCAESLSTGAIDAASGFHVLVAGAPGAAPTPGTPATAGTTGAAGTPEPGEPVGAAQPEAQILAVSGVIVYERFSRRLDAGDAALLVLATPTTAPPVALATAADAGATRPGRTATIAGWGVASFNQRHLTNALRTANTVVQGSRWCARNAPPFFVRTEICTIDPPAYATGACHGDSGGPLLAPLGAGGEQVEIGITVHGYGRCSTRLPSVFTSIAPIASWVQTWIAAYNKPPAAPPATTTEPPAP
jgi:secreted trypsin-like serine protease